MEQKREKVKILPKSKRASDRITQHGEVMMKEDEKGDMFFVRSLNKTFRGEEWAGWFNQKTEAGFKVIKESV